MSVPPKIADALRPTSLLSVPSLDPARETGDKRTSHGPHGPHGNGKRVLEHVEWVRCLARNLVRDPSGAEDVAQEALLAALSSPPRDVADSPRLKAWLGRVTHNLSHLAVRRNLRRRWREECAAQEESLGSTVDHVAHSGILEELKASVCSLDEPYRSAVEMRYFEGLPIVKIAERAGVSENAVRKRLWRARNQLRHHLEGKHNGERAAWFSSLIPWLSGDRSAGFAGLFGMAAAGALLFVTLGAVTLLREHRDDSAVRSETVAAAPTPVPERRALTPPQRMPFAPRGTSDPRSLTERGAAGTAIVDPPRDKNAVTVAPNSGIVVRGVLKGMDGLPLADIALVAAGAPEQVLVRTAFDGGFRFRTDDLPLELQLGTERWLFLCGAGGSERIRSGGEETLHTLYAAPALTVRGLVLSDGGQALGGARIELRFDERAFLYVDEPLRMDADVALGKAGPDGGFELTVPVWEGIALAFSHPEHSTTVVPTAELYPGIDVYLSRTPELLADAAHAFGVGSRTAGREFPAHTSSLDGDLGRLRGRLIGANGRPQANWHVVARAENEEPAEGGLVSMERQTTDEDGTFDLRGKLGQGYLLMAYHPGNLESVTEGPFYPGAEAIEMRYVSGAAGQRRSVSGRVLDGDGLPLANARLDVMLVMGSMGIGVRVPTTRFVHTDEEGGFRLGDLPSEAMVIEVQHPSGSKEFDPDGGTLVVLEGEAYLALEDTQADAFAVLDADGLPLILRGPLSSAERVGVHHGRTPMVAIEGTAHTLVLFTDGVEVRSPLSLAPGASLRLRP